MFLTEPNFLLEKRKDPSLKLPASQEGPALPHTAPGGSVRGQRVEQLNVARPPALAQVSLRCPAPANLPVIIQPQEEEGRVTETGGRG